MKICIINGPNLNFLGTREPGVYGEDSLEDIQNYTEDCFKNADVQTEWFQNNIEGEIINKIQSLVDSDTDALIINPGGYSHTSVAIHDALKILRIPVIEVHLSNVYAREEFRRTLLTAGAANTIMSGLGKRSYELAIYSLIS